MPRAPTPLLPITLGPRSARRSEQITISLLVCLAPCSAVVGRFRLLAAGHLVSGEQSAAAGTRRTCRFVARRWLSAADLAGRAEWVPDVVPMCSRLAALPEKTPDEGRLSFPTPFRELAAWHLRLGCIAAYRMSLAVQAAAAFSSSPGRPLQLQFAGRCYFLRWDAAKAFPSAYWRISWRRVGTDVRRTPHCMYLRPFVSTHE